MISPPFSVKKFILESWRKRKQAREAPATFKAHQDRLPRPTAKHAHRPPPPDRTSIESHL